MEVAGYLPCASVRQAERFSMIEIGRMAIEAFEATFDHRATSGGIQAVCKCLHESSLNALKIIHTCHLKLHRSNEASSSSSDQNRPNLSLSLSKPKIEPLH